MNREKLSATITISAPKNRVWRVLLEDETYRKWTAVFCEGSYVEGDWSEGSMIRFLTPSNEGMVSKVAVHRPDEILTLQHLGIVKDGQDDFESEVSRTWAGSTETYRVSESNGVTTLRIEQEIGRDHLEWFTKTWNEALAKVKALSESAGDR